jgi:hypothetical protein
MSIVSNVGTIFYNGVTWPVETQTIGMDIKPIPDSAGRTVVANQYTLKLKGIFALTAPSAGQTLDTTIAFLRQALTAPGGAFVYTGKGLGNLILNYPGGARELAWGPRCEGLSITPLGNLAAEVVWTVSMQTMDCSAAISAFGVMEFAYKVEFTIGHDRLTRAAHTGFLRIPQTRINVGNKFLSDTADRWYEQVVPTIWFGWRRESERFGFDESKCRLDFSISDAQQKMPLPEGVVDMRVDHEQQNDPPVQFWMKKGRISAEYEMALHWPASTAQFYFDNLWIDKLTSLQADGAVIIPQVYTARESTQERKSNFSLTYWLLRTRNLIGLLGGGGAGAAGLTPPPGALGKVVGSEGFWRPVPGASYEAWRRSMDLATVPRGYTQNHIRPQDDAIIDLCLSNPRGIGPGTNRYGTSPDAVYNGRAMLVTVPDAPNSWVWYECNIVVSPDDGIVEHKPLPKKPKPVLPPSLVDVFNGVDGFNPTPDPSPEISIVPQRRTTATVHLWLKGRAVRIGYAINPPNLVSVGGAAAFRSCREESEYYVHGVVPGTPIVVAEWALRYALETNPRQWIGVPYVPQDSAAPNPPQTRPTGPPRPTLNLGGGLTLDFSTGVMSDLATGAISPLPVIIGGGGGSIGGGPNPFSVPR